MNNNNPRFGRLTVLAALLILATALVTGCGSDPGPSADKVRLDLLDQVNRAYSGLLETDDFTINDRKQLSEDRIQMHVVVGYKVDPEQAEKIKQSQKMIGYQSPALERARRNEGKDQELTLLYQRSGEDAWKLTRIQPGYQ